MDNIILGYLLSFVYMIAVILVGETVQKKLGTDKELTRKVEHIATSASWALCYVFVGATYHLVIVNLLALVGLTLITFGGLMKSVEREDTARSWGLMYFGISTFVNAALAVFIDIRLVPLTCIAYYCLSLADGFAPITARAAGKYNREIFISKTLVGFLTVFAVSGIVTFAVSKIFGLGYSALLILSVGSLAAHAELYGNRGLDNLTLPFSVFGYLALDFYGLVPQSMQIALVILPVFTLLAAFGRSMTFFGGAVSFLYVTLSALFGVKSTVFMIFILFFTEAIVSKLTSKARKSSKIGETSGGRGGYQMICNTVTALCLIAVFYFTQARGFMLLSAIVVAEEFSDSIASGVGRLSRRSPIDILRFRRVEAGVSGGVSLIGLASALVASYLAMGILYLFGDITLEEYLVLGVLPFAGTLIDSVLGSGIQALYRCCECGLLVESPMHCDRVAKRIKGLPFINNSTVNLLSGALCAVLSGLLILGGVL